MTHNIPQIVNNNVIRPHQFKLPLSHIAAIYREATDRIYILF